MTALEELRAGMLLGLHNAKGHRDSLVAQMAEVERDIAGTEGAVMLLSQLIEDERKASE